MTSVLTTCRSGRASGDLSVACPTGLVFIVRRQYKIILNIEDGFLDFDTILSVARYQIIIGTKSRIRDNHRIYLLSQGRMKLDKLRTMGTSYEAE